MGNVRVPPSDHCRAESGIFLTFIVPAEAGCSLSCAFCFIRQRREIVDLPHPLSPEDFARFIREAAEREDVCGIAIQGYEPLLPSSLPYTEAILAAARQLSIPASMVTNGVALKAAIPLLRTLAPQKIAISLDSPSAVRHDRLRGMSGAWAATVDGIRHAVNQLPGETSLAVTSVLLPSSVHTLRDMPRLLKELGIGHWMLSPLVRIKRNGAAQGEPAAEKIADGLLQLQDEADEAGIRLTVDDEFDHLDHRRLTRTSPDLRRVEFRNLPRSLRLFRLLPSGHCSSEDYVLEQLRDDTPLWRPAAEHATQFLARFPSLEMRAI